jgi:hypothetical protein
MYQLLNKTKVEDIKVIALIERVLYLDAASNSVLPKVEDVKKVVVVNGKNGNMLMNFIT